MKFIRNKKYSMKNFSSSFC